MPGQSSKSLSSSVGLLIVLHVLIVLPLAYFLNIWADEASTLYTTQHGFLAAFESAAANEKQAPLYFWILSVWRSINQSVFFARLFSVICTVVAIKLFAGLAERVLGLRAALLATAFFALHPVLIWASLEIRGYSLVILLSIVLIRLFLDVFWAESHAKPQRRGMVLFLVAAIVSLYTNYYLGFLLVGFFASLLIGKKWRAARAYIALMAAACLAFVPMLFTIRAQLSANTGGFQPDRSVVEGLRHLWHHVVSFVLPAKILSDDDPTIFSIFHTWTVRVLAAVIAVLSVANWKRISPLTAALAAIIFVVGICLLAAYFAFGPIYIALRHASVLFAPLVIFGASLLSDLSRNWTDRTVKMASFAAGIVVLASFSYSLASLYPNMTKRGDWARVAEFIEQNERPGQPILVFTTFDALALPYHYNGVNRILPDEKFFAFELEAEFGTPGSLETETEFLISKIPPGSEAIWLATNEKCIKTAACTQLENYVKANYTIEIEKEFYLEKLYLLKRKRQ